jgi:hypothetical protein
MQESDWAKAMDRQTQLLHALACKQVWTNAPIGTTGIRRQLLHRSGTNSDAGQAHVVRLELSFQARRDPFGCVDTIKSLVKRPRSGDHVVLIQPPSFECTLALGAVDEVQSFHLARGWWLVLNALVPTRHEHPFYDEPE